VLALIAAAAVGGIGFYLTRLRDEPVGRALRVALWCLLGGLVLYIGHLVYEPGAIWLRERSGVWTSGWVTLLGGAVALAAILITARLRRPAPG
jgi:hypothetical protein